MKICNQHGYIIYISIFIRFILFYFVLFFFIYILLQQWIVKTGWREYTNKKYWNFAKTNDRNLIVISYISDKKHKLHYF